MFRDAERRLGYPTFDHFRDFRYAERTRECTNLPILKCLAFLKILCFLFLFYFPLVLLTTGTHIGPQARRKTCAKRPKSGDCRVTFWGDRKNDEKWRIFTRASRKGFELRCTKMTKSVLFTNPQLLTVPEQSFLGFLAL